MEQILDGARPHRSDTAWSDTRALALTRLLHKEAVALERPAMTYVREQLRQRLGQQVWQAWWRWLYPTSGRRPADRFL